MAELAYLNFDVQIVRAEQGYRVEVDSPTGQATGAFAVPFSDLELENFRLQIGGSLRRVRRVDSPALEAIKTAGARLYAAVFHDQVRDCLLSSIDEAERQGAGLRIKLRLTNAPELAALPWEYLYNATLNHFLILSAKTPIVRFLELPQRIRPLAMTPPLHVLVMIASPHDYPPLDTEREWAKLKLALGDLEQRGLVVLERLETATLSALQQRLRRGAYHIFHFVGHGGFDEPAQDGVLLLEDEEGNGHRISGQELGTLLHDEDTLRLALLNACEGARASRSDAFAGTAQSLIQKGVPAVIAMQFEITDDAAIRLANEFYAALADGYPVDAALAEARKALFTEGGGLEWGTPVLYMRAPDGRIFDVAPVTPSSSAQPVAAAAAGGAARQGAADHVRGVDDATATGASGGTIAAPPAALPTARWLLAGLAAVAVVLVAAGILLLGGFAGGRATPTIAAQSSATPGSIVIASTPQASPTNQPTAAPSSPTELAVPSPVAPPATDTSMPQVPPTTTSPPTAAPTSPPAATATGVPTATPTRPPAATPTPCATSLLQSGFGRLWNARLAIQQRLGCPLAGEQGSSIAEQPFEHGSMLWFGLDNTIYVLSDQGAWSAFPNTQQQGEDAPPQERTPVGLVRPVAGFGLVWDTHAQVRQALGWGTEPEAGRFNGARQEFARGVMLFSETGLGRGKMIYVLYADGRLEQYEDQP